MKTKYALILITASLALSLSQGQEVDTLAPDAWDAELAWSEDFRFPDVEEGELAATDLAEKFTKGDEKPTIGENGRLIYTFGRSVPVIVCTPLYATEIALEPGEVVTMDGVHLGDTTRWITTPSLSGPEGARRIHILVKPTEMDISTNMIVMTDRRIYHIQLVSRNTKWVPSVGFAYPEHARARWIALQQKQQREKADRTIPSTQQDVADLDFSYDIKGNAPWKPERVYNDGAKTYIQFNAKSIKNTDAPALMIVGSNGKKEITNYRVRDNVYVADIVFGEAVLFTGHGWKQKRITLKYKPKVK